MSHYLEHQYYYSAKPDGGEGGIRTPGALSGSLAFQASALGHYATSPCLYDSIWHDIISKRSDIKTYQYFPPSNTLPLQPSLLAELRLASLQHQTLFPSCSLFAKVLKYAVLTFIFLKVPVLGSKTRFV